MTKTNPTVEAEEKTLEEMEALPELEFTIEVLEGWPDNVHPLINFPSLSRLKALAAEVRRLHDEKDRWRLALEGLTAGGSEFVNDLDNCLAYIEHRRSHNHEVLKSKCREVKQLREEKEIAVKVGDDDDEDYETSGPEPCDECGFHACHCDCRCGAFRSGRQIADCVC